MFSTQLWNLTCFSLVFLFHFSSANSPINDLAAKINNATNSINGDLFGTPRHARILIFPPILFESHLFIFKTLAKGLQNYGHHVTLFVSDRRTIEEDSPDFSIRRFPGIFSSEEAGSFLQQKVGNILAGKPTFLEMLDILGRYSKNCDEIFSEGYQSILQLRKDKYDLTVVDPNEMCGFLVAKHLGLPYVVFSTGMWVPYEAYVPSPISYVPEFNSQFSDRMNFWQRFQNTFIYGISRFGTKYLIFPIYDRLITKHKLGTFNMAQLIQNVKCWLLCTDLALEFPRPSMPYIEYVGGILGRPSKPLSPALKEWADNAGESGGFIVVSFGAGVQRLDPKLESTFVRALSKLPVQVIWRYTTQLQGLGPNVKLVNWLPQNDLLGHSNVLAFVGHGGTNGVYECLFHGVPIVGMPLFGDHYDAMTRVHAKKIGIKLDWRGLTEQELIGAIQETIHNPQYRNNVRRLSKVHHDQPMTPLQRAAHRIDYTLRYNGADHLRPEVYNLSTIQYFLIDVQFAVIIISSLIIGGTFWFLERRRQSQQQSKYTSLSSPSMSDHYHSPSTASGLRHSDYRSLRMNGTPGGCLETSSKLCCIKDVYSGVGNGLLWISGRLRLLAVYLASHCGILRRSSRVFLKCLDAITNAVRCVFPSKLGTLQIELESETKSCRLSADQQPTTTDPDPESDSPQHHGGARDRKGGRRWTPQSNRSEADGVHEEKSPMSNNRDERSSLRSSFEHILVGTTCAENLNESSRNRYVDRCTQTSLGPPLIMEGDNVVVPIEEKPIEEITPQILKGWLRRAKRKFKSGVVVLKVTSTGKLVRRTVFVGAKTEYFEITSAKLFDLGYHLSDVDEVRHGCDSPEFISFITQNPERVPNAEKSCVVQVESRPISLVFKTESDRRDFVFLMRVEMKALQTKYAYVSKKYQARQATTSQTPPP